MPGVVVWMDARDLDPPHGLDMGSRHDREKVEALCTNFRFDGGFDREYPALVGYVRDGRVQLLSGTHRHRAALMAGVQLPVTLWRGSDVERALGRPGALAQGGGRRPLPGAGGVDQGGPGGEGRGVRLLLKVAVVGLAVVATPVAVACHVLGYEAARDRVVELVEGASELVR
jgi:hypothetical protein